MFKLMYPLDLIELRIASLKLYLLLLFVLR